MCHFFFENGLNQSIFQTLRGLSMFIRGPVPFEGVAKEAPHLWILGWIACASMLLFGAKMLSTQIPEESNNKSIETTVTTEENVSNLNSDEYKQLDNKIFENETVGYIVVGDSRTVGLSNTIGEDILKSRNIFIAAKVGQGLNWYEKEGVSLIKKIQENNHFDRWVIIFNLGVNDLYHINEYKDTLLNLQEDYDVITVSVNPVIDEKISSVSNSDIEDFNKQIQTVSNRYIDTYSYLQKNGFSSSDGLHYNNATYETIFDIISNEINSSENNMR